MVSQENAKTRSVQTRCQNIPRNLFSIILLKIALKLLPHLISLQLRVVPNLPAILYLTYSFKTGNSCYVDGHKSEVLV